MTRLDRALLLGSLLVGLAMVLPLVVLVRDKWEPLRRFDTGLVSELALPAGWARSGTLALTQLGAPLLLEVVAVLVAVVLVRRGQRRLALYVAVSVLGAQVLSTLLKDVIGRVRPCVDLASCPSTSSFPSGHSVGAAAFWTTMAVVLLPVLGRRAWLLLTLPVVVGATRVLLGVHYPSDVVAGLLVGGCWAAAASAVFAAWRDQREERDVPVEEGVE